MAMVMALALALTRRVSCRRRRVLGRRRGLAVCLWAVEGAVSRTSSVPLSRFWRV